MGVILSVVATFTADAGSRLMDLTCRRAQTGSRVRER